MAEQTFPGSPALVTLQYVCPSCRQGLESSEIGYGCPVEGFRFTNTQGVPDFILPGRRQTVDEFLSVYNTVRKSEEWGSRDFRYYLELPYNDTTGKHSSIWRLRARTYDCFIRDLVSGSSAGSLAFLDLGAGNCWLSFRLTQRGQRGFAVDTNLSAHDGLAVASRMATSRSLDFIPVRAEFDFLPFPESQFDLIIFNASLHYALDPLETISKVFPLLKPNGVLYLLDSPIYRDAWSGEAMVRERMADFKRRYGFTLQRTSAGSFLTFELIDQLRQRFHVQLLFPRYGLRWAVRERAMPLLLGREPARFHVVNVVR